MGVILPPLSDKLKLRPKGAIWAFKILQLLTLAYKAPFYQFLCRPTQIFLIYDFFSKLCQTKIAIFRDFLIYNDRIEKSNFSVKNYQIITKIDRNVQIDVIFKISISFWKIGIFSRIYRITQFLKFYLNFTVIHPDVGEL